MAKPLHTVAETSPYLADAAKAGLSAEEMQAIVAAIATDPEQGDLVQGSGRVRKVRIAGRGKGKSGGYRTATMRQPIYWRSWASTSEPISRMPK